MKTNHSEWSRGGGRVLALGLIAAMPVFAACDDDPVGEDDPTIAELAATTPQLSTLTAALQAAELVETLDEGGPFTVFAPVNAAFAALGEDRIERLLEEGNEELLSKVLTYHVVPGEILSSELTDGARVATVEGSELTITLGDGARVNGARIIATDLVADNGVVHLVEGVLTQNLDLVDVATLEGFSALVGAVQAAGLEQTLRSGNGGAGYTIFAPTDAAFAELDEVPTDADVLSQVLLYHAVGDEVPASALGDEQVVTTLQGGTFTVDLTGGIFIDGNSNTAAVLATDVMASNGIIHPIDAVLLP